MLAAVVALALSHGRMTLPQARNALKSGIDAQGCNSVTQQFTVPVTSFCSGNNPNSVFCTGTGAQTPNVGLNGRQAPVAFCGITPEGGAFDCTFGNVNPHTIAVSSNGGETGGWYTCSSNVPCSTQKQPAVMHQYLWGNIVVLIDISAQHRGYFEFQFCPCNNPGAGGLCTETDPFPNNYDPQLNVPTQQQMRNLNDCFRRHKLRPQRWAPTTMHPNNTIAGGSLLMSRVAPNWPDGTGCGNLWFAEAGSTDDPGSVSVEGYGDGTWHEPCSATQGRPCRCQCLQGQGGSNLNYCFDAFPSLPFAAPIAGEFLQPDMFLYNGSMGDQCSNASNHCAFNLLTTPGVSTSGPAKFMNKLECVSSECNGTQLANPNYCGVGNNANAHSFMAYLALPDKATILQEHPQAFESDNATLNHAMLRWVYIDSNDAQLAYPEMFVNVADISVADAFAQQPSCVAKTAVAGMTQAYCNHVNTNNQSLFREFGYRAQTEADVGALNPGQHFSGITVQPTPAPPPTVSCNASQPNGGCLLRRVTDKCVNYSGANFVESCFAYNTSVSPPSRVLSFDACCQAYASVNLIDGRSVSGCGSLDGASANCGSLQGVDCFRLRLQADAPCEPCMTPADLTSANRLNLTAQQHANCKPIPEYAYAYQDDRTVTCPIDCSKNYVPEWNSSIPKTAVSCSNADTCASNATWPCCTSTYNTFGHAGPLMPNYVCCGHGTPAWNNISRWTWPGVYVPSAPTPTPPAPTPPAPTPPAPTPPAPASTNNNRVPKGYKTATIILGVLLGLAAAAVIWMNIKCRHNDRDDEEGGGIELQNHRHNDKQTQRRSGGDGNSFLTHKLNFKL